MSSHLIGELSVSTHEYEKCVGRNLRYGSSAVIWSRMLDTTCSITAPPTAPSGLSTDTLSRNASDATTSSCRHTYITMTPRRSTDGPEPNDPPIGERAGCHPKNTPPTR